MLSFLRGTMPPRTSTAHLTTVEYEEGRSSQTFHPASEPYFVTHHIPPNKPTRSFFNPPMHLHLSQTEQFKVTLGSGVWYQPTHPKPSMRKQVKSAGDTPIDLPAGTFHHFENTSDTDPLVVHIRVDPPGMNRVDEEGFFRNFFGYLEDCRKAGVTPSIFQLELFLHTIDGPLAIPIPGPDWLKLWVSKAFMVVLGVIIGEWLLGYQRSYSEYYNARRTGLTR